MRLVRRSANCLARAIPISTRPSFRFDFKSATCRRDFCQVFSSSKEMSPKTNADLLGAGLKIAAKKKKLRASQIPEINWDDDSRRFALSLCGF
jgi:hypothetical protein